MATTRAEAEKNTGKRPEQGSLGDHLHQWNRYGKRNSDCLNRGKYREKKVLGFHQGGIENSPVRD